MNDQTITFTSYVDVQENGDFPDTYFIMDPDLELLAGQDVTVTVTVASNAPDLSQLSFAEAVSALNELSATKIMGGWAG